MIAPDSFQLSDIDGTSSPVTDVVPLDHEAAVREAARSCPEQAIRLTADSEAVHTAAMSKGHSSDRR
jgi:ferredoxin